MRRAVAALALAVEFLTIVRLRRAVAYDGPAIGASLAWFPVVGLALGAAFVAVDRAAAALWTGAVAAALVVLAAAALTSALHLDGLADSADGLFGGHTPERRLAIMKDSRTGAFGVVAVAAVVLLQAAAVAALPPERRVAALLLAPVLARLAMVVAVAAFPYARPEGLGRMYHDHARPWPVTLATATALLVSLVVAGPIGAVAVVVAVLAALLLGRVAARRLGGLTGDTYGAIGLLVEVGALLAFGVRLSLVLP